MKIVGIAATAEQKEEGAARPIVHIPGEAVSGHDTLCGHVDRTTWRWEEKPRAKVNCSTCLRIFDYVKGATLP